MSILSTKNLVRVAYVAASTTLVGCVSPDDAEPVQIAIYQAIYSGEETTLVFDAVSGGAIAGPDERIELVEIDYGDQQDIRPLKSDKTIDLKRIKGVVRISPFSLPIESSYFDIQEAWFPSPISDHGFYSFSGIPTPGYLLSLAGGEGQPNITMIDTLSDEVVCSSVMWDVKVGEKVSRKGVLEISLQKMTLSKDLPWPQMGIIADEKKLTAARSSIERCFAAFEKVLLGDMAQP